MNRLKRMLPRRTSITDIMVAGALMVLCLNACSVYRSRYFQRVGTDEVRLDQYRLSPRIFAYLDEKVSSQRVARGSFTVTVRLDDAATEIGDYQRQPAQSVTDSLADRFLADVTDRFTVDSLVLHEIPSTRVNLDTVGLGQVVMRVQEEGPPFNRIRLEPDRRNYTPRRENYLTLKFGETVLDQATAALRAVLHVNRPGPPPSVDSAVFLMTRVETEGKGLMMFRENVQGY